MKYLPSLDPPRRGDVQIWFSKQNRIVIMAKYTGVNEQQDIVLVDSHYSPMSHIRIFKLK